MLNEKALQNLPSWEIASPVLKTLFTNHMRGWPDNSDDATVEATIDAWTHFSAAFHLAGEYIANQLAPVNGALLDMRNAHIRGNYGQ